MLAAVYLGSFPLLTATVFRLPLIYSPPRRIDQIGAGSWGQPGGHNGSRGKRRIAVSQLHERDYFYIDQLRRLSYSKSWKPGLKYFSSRLWTSSALAYP